MIKIIKKGILLSGIICLTVSYSIAQNQPFYFGADLSYVNQMEDCGADYKRGGFSEDPYKIFADLGTNLVRVRLWVDPSWWQEPLNQPDGVNPYYSDLEDVKETIQRAKNNGMEVLLDFHYSDFWADPGRQQIPRQWLDVAEDTDALADSVYQYTRDVLTTLEEEGLMPNIVQVGNENNSGILIHIPEEDGFETARSVSSVQNWSRHAQLFNAGISAVREVGETASVNPKIALHKADLDGLEWWVNNIISHGVTDFDIIGFSYYFAWHGESISQLETDVSKLVETFSNFELMALETGYLWSDEYGGIINEPDPEYLPVVPGKQLEYMADYGRAVMRAGGSGVIFWEPAWVDTHCRTPWITGSSHTHVAFFDPFNTNFMELGGGTWPNREYYENLDAPKATFKVDMTGQDVSDEGVFITGDFTGDESWELRQMADEGDGIYSYFAYLPQNAEGAFYFLNGNDWNARERVPAECADRWETDREYVMGEDETFFAYTWGSCESLYSSIEVNATFKVDMANSGVDFANGVYITGDLTDWAIEPMSHDGDQIYSWQASLSSGSEGAYYYLTTDTWESYQDYRETVPVECAEWYDTDRGYVIPDGHVEIGFIWGTCQKIELSTSTENISDEVPGFELHQNYPNPFNPITNITYRLTKSTIVSLKIFDMTGREIKELVNSRQSSGVHQVQLNADELSSGIYLYRLSADGIKQTRQMTLVK